MAKVTLSTIKAFVRKNEGRLHIKEKSRFDGMVDCVMPTGDGAFHPALKDERGFTDNTMDIQGAWFVKGSRDWFTPYEDEKFVGYDISNCCGSFTLAVPK